MYSLFLILVIRYYCRFPHLFELPYDIHLYEKRIILPNHKINLVGISNMMSNAAKNFDILATNLGILY